MHRRSSRCRTRIRKHPRNRCRRAAPAPTTPLPQSALYDYSQVQGPGGCGTYTSGPACQECVSGGHWGGWLPRCGAWLPHLFTAHHGGGCGGNMCTEEPCAGGACAGNACAGNACGGCPTCCPWFGGIYGLVLTRTDDARTTLSYDDANWGDPLLRTSDADAGYLGGAEVRFGRYLNECYALQAGYWGLVPNEAEANVCNACMNVELTTPIRFDNLVYDNGIFADNVLRWFGVPGDPALRHRLRRSYEVQNIELNLIRNPYRRTGCVHYELLAGIRYLRLDDDFSFATDYTSDAFGDDPANEVDYNIEVDNNLLGFQVGGRMDYYVWGGLALNLGTAIGIYGNHMTQQQYIWGGNGFAYVDGTGDVYNVERSSERRGLPGRSVCRSIVRPDSAVADYVRLPRHGGDGHRAGDEPDPAGCRIRQHGVFTDLGFERFPRAPRRLCRPGIQLVTGKPLQAALEIAATTSPRSTDRSGALVVRRLDGGAGSHRAQTTTPVSARNSGWWRTGLKSTSR